MHHLRPLHKYMYNKEAWLPALIRVLIKRLSHELEIVCRTRSLEQITLLISARGCGGGGGGGVIKEKYSEIFSVIGLFSWSPFLFWWQIFYIFVVVLCRYSCLYA